jgi:hypothetical protein
MGIRIASTQDNDYGHPIKPCAVYAAFIDPDGRFFAVTYGGHNDFAERFHDTWSEGLERRGWVHFSSPQTVSSGRHLTDAQVSTLLELADAFRRNDDNLPRRDHVIDTIEYVIKTGGCTA